MESRHKEDWLANKLGCIREKEVTWADSEEFRVGVKHDLINLQVLRTDLAAEFLKMFLEQVDM